MSLVLGGLLPFLFRCLRRSRLPLTLCSALLLLSLPLGGRLRSLFDSSLRKNDIAEEDQQLCLEDELAIFPALLLAPSL